MSKHGTMGGTPLERVQHRYEATERKCSECGYVDDDGRWTSRTDGQQVVYEYVCLSCGADHERVIRLNR